MGLTETNRIEQHQSGSNSEVYYRPDSAKARMAVANAEG